MQRTRIFISHAWLYNSEYYRLVELLEDYPDFDFYNHSVPEHDPLDFETTKELEQKLLNQMRGSQAVIVIAGMYAAYRNWIQKEIEVAKSWGKPIIGVKPWGQLNIPKVVTDNADIVVGWNAKSVVDAINKTVYGV